MNKKFGFIFLVSFLAGLFVFFTSCTKTRYDDENDFQTALRNGGSYVEIIYYAGGKQNISIPPSIGNIPVVMIGEESFMEKGVVSVTIPGSVTTIRDWAFSSNQLSEVTIPQGVTTIGEYAFSWNHLTQVTIPLSITTIGFEAFADNQLTRIVIGANVALNRAFGSGFEDFYNNNDRLAGTYTRSSPNSSDWARR
jgi:hypothetical protein